MARKRASAIHKNNFKYMSNSFDILLNRTNFETVIKINTNITDIYVIEDCS